MARRAFYSFHYKPDNWRASQVRNIGSVEGNKPATDNDWESIKKGGDSAIKRWINDQMFGKSCVIVLIGSETAGRKWINYEIEKAWNDGKGLLGIYIHRLKDRYENTGVIGSNPFDEFNFSGKKLSAIVRAYNPAGATSKDVYETISSNLADWLDEAVRIRDAYKG